jgi:hypothetical protein
MHVRFLRNITHTKFVTKTTIRLLHGRPIVVTSAMYDLYCFYVPCRRILKTFYLLYIYISKGKLSLCLTKHHASHEDVLGEWMYSSTHSLTSALDGGEWSASRPGHFTPTERAPGTHWIGAYGKDTSIFKPWNVSTLFDLILNFPPPKYLDLYSFYVPRGRILKTFYLLYIQINVS